MMLSWCLDLVANQLEYDAVLMSRGVFHYDLVANQLEYDAVLMSRGVFHYFSG